MNDSEKVEMLLGALKKIHFGSNHAVDCIWHERRSLSDARCNCRLWDNQELKDNAIAKAEGKGD